MISNTEKIIIEDPKLRRSYYNKIRGYLRYYIIEQLGCFNIEQHNVSGRIADVPDPLIDKFVDNLNSKNIIPDVLYVVSKNENTQKENNYFLNQLKTLKNKNIITYGVGSEKICFFHDYNDKHEDNLMELRMKCEVKIYEINLSFIKTKVINGENIGL